MRWPLLAWLLAAAAASDCASPPCFGPPKLECWGDGTPEVLAPPAGIESPVEVLAVGGIFACAQSSGAQNLTCWGEGTAAGELHPPPLTSPLELQTDNQFLRSRLLSLGARHGCLVESGSTNTVKCWGANNDGQAPPVTTLGWPVYSLSCGNQHTCVVTGPSNNKGVQCWGQNIFGQSTVPLAFKDGVGAGVVTVHASSFYTCAWADSSGSLGCWGAYGDVLPAPSNLLGPLVLAVTVSYACARDGTGTVHCWGGSANDPLPMVPSNLATEVGDLHAGYSFFCVELATAPYAYCDKYAAPADRGKVSAMATASSGTLICAELEQPLMSSTTMSSTWTTSSTSLSTSGTSTTSQSSTTTSPTSTSTLSTSSTSSTLSSSRTSSSTSSTSSATTSSTSSGTTSTTSTLSSSTTSSWTRTSTTPTTLTSSSTSTRSTSSPSSTLSSTSSSTWTRTSTTSTKSTSAARTPSTTSSSSTSRTSTVTTDSPGMATSSSTSTMASSSTSSTSSSSRRTRTWTFTSTKSGASTSTSSLTETGTSSTAVATSSTATGTSVTVTGTSSGTATGTFAPTEGTSATATSLATGTSSATAAGGTPTTQGLAGGHVSTGSPWTSSTLASSEPSTLSSTISSLTMSSLLTSTVSTTVSTTRSTSPVLAPEVAAARSIAAAVRGAAVTGLTRGGSLPAGLVLQNLTAVLPSQGGAQDALADESGNVRGGLALATDGSESAGRLALAPRLLRELQRRHGGGGETLLLAMLRVAGNESRDLRPLGELAPASEVMDVSIFYENGSLALLDFNQPLLLRMPGNGTRGRCVFLEGDLLTGPLHWSQRGVRDATDEEVAAAGEDPAGIWCATTHLSIFAALKEASLGCTNIELFSREALETVARNAEWYHRQSAFIVFFMWGVLALGALTGQLVECWALRLGRTTAGKSPRVSICRGFMSCGLHLLKHRYAVFVIYARDIFNCIAADKVELKNAVLTASCQRFLAVRTGISLSTVQQHCWNGSDWLETEVSLPFTVLCRKLEFHAGEAERVIQMDIFAPGISGVLRRTTLTFLAMHPMLDSMRVGHGSMTAGKRAALQIASVCGIVATNAFIFNFAGGLRHWEADASCPVTSTSYFFVVVATIASVILNIIPVAFLTSLAKQVFKRPFWLCVFWALTNLYLAGTVLLIVVALANLNDGDQDVWYEALEWGVAVKLLGMPCAQALRNCFMLEAFLRRDRRCEPQDRFGVIMGLQHPNEKKLSPEDVNSALRMAHQAISAEELVKFTAMLGDIVMPEFDPEISTSDDVMHGAIEPLCIHPPALERYPVTVEVREVCGLECVQKTLACTVLHLGESKRNVRECLGTKKIKPADVSLEGGVARCAWGQELTLYGLETQHALGFLVADEKGRSVGVTSLVLEDVLAGDGRFEGVLPLDTTEVQAKPLELFAMPLATRSVPHKEVSGSRGQRSSQCRPLAMLVVSLELPDGYLEAMSLHELRKLKSIPLDHNHSELAVLARQRAQSPPDWTEVLSAGAFCEAHTYQGERLPPERMVVHSRKGKFVDLVAAVLVDALDREGAAAFQEVRKLILEKDCLALQDMLQEDKRQGTRYWIEMFAINPVEYYRPHAEGKGHWHEGFLNLWPTILRAMRRFSAQKTVCDIMAGSYVPSPRPLKQLLVLDRQCHFMHENGCLAELMLARAMRVQQQLVLHPEHLHCTSLGEELRRFSQELDEAYDEEDVSYMAPYLEDRPLVFEALRELVICSVAEQRGDDQETWRELDLTDIFAAGGAVFASRSTLRQGQDGDNVQMDDVGGADGGD